MRIYTRFLILIYSALQLVFPYSLLHATNSVWEIPRVMCTPLLCAAARYRNVFGASMGDLSNLVDLLAGRGDWPRTKLVPSPILR